ncbi:MAG: hypothetical protein E7412_07210 [Ruminococcaceae bacterium]|nr:hypothetical protein [Oscillospiraceae bacterium]
MRENGVVTLFTLDEKKESFVKLGVYPAWIYHKERLRNTEKGVYKRDNFDVRIKHDLLERVSLGDLVFFGELPKQEFELSQCRRISAVSENNIGSCPHWHIQAEYEYK